MIRLDFNCLIPTLNQKYNSVELDHQNLFSTDLTDLILICF